MDWPPRCVVGARRASQARTVSGKAEMGGATIVSYPGVMMPAQQVALAFDEVGELRAFATTLAFHASEPFFRLAPSGIRRELARREVSTVPASRLQRHPLWEVFRTAAARGNASPEFVDRVWDAG